MRHTHSRATHKQIAIWNIAHSTLRELYLVHQEPDVSGRRRSTLLRASHVHVSLGWVQPKPEVDADVALLRAAHRVPPAERQVQQVAAPDGHHVGLRASEGAVLAGGGGRAAHVDARVDARGVALARGGEEGRVGGVEEPGGGEDEPGACERRA